ncbi:MAG: DUF1592 domain-containing protein [Planctomicrobium sp.]|jgi:hypothetical protein|nr:DUF1592 domain-containing protein [Planctomicrobium sp.]
MNQFTAIATYSCLAIYFLSHSSDLFALEPQAAKDGQSHYVTNVFPFVNEYCVACHSGDAPEGGLDFERFAEGSSIQEKYELWEHVQRLILEQQMPPSDAEQPTSEQVVSILEAIQLELNTFDCDSEKHPGRVTIRRLNKAEYDNTIRDLLGLDLNLSEDFPADDVGNGFDNIGDVLAIPPVLLEKYLLAAQTIAQKAVADQEIRKRIEVHVAKNDDERLEIAIRNIREFAERAYRRPLTEYETQRISGLLLFAWQQDSSVEEILETIIAAVLTNPNFLFRVEQDPASDDTNGIRSLNSFELASRLSYFLWSSMPDEELFKLARAGDLEKPEVLKQQARRMLADPKAVALVENFAGQWLQLRDVPKLSPDPDKFPNLDQNLQLAMRRETELFFENVVKNDLSILGFLNSDETFVNEQLALHYGMSDIQGPDFRKVKLSEGRRGILTHASILMLTSNPTRTSPVKRGKWILDNILAEPPPPPPANVPELEEGGETLGSLREQMEQHRSNESCAACHRKMDALGFGLENYDAIGGWRDRDGRFEIDASGELPGGKKFDGAAELMGILVDEKKTEFTRCLTKKMLTYALGRGLESYDRCAVNEIVSELEANDYRFSTLITEIVTSAPFTLRESRREE